MNNSIINRIPKKKNFEINLKKNLNLLVYYFLGNELLESDLNKKAKSQHS